MLRVNDVIKVDYERKRIRKEIYKRIYEQFCRKVRQSTEMGYKHTLLTVPSFVFGYPTFDRDIATEYLRRQFENGGFEASYVEPYSIYVSWNIQKNRAREKPQEEAAAIEEDEIDFPSFMNLKKAANKYRKGA